MARKPAYAEPEEEFARTASRSIPVSTRSAKADAPPDPDFDARMLDLDVDDSSAFLRAQKRVPVRRGALPKKTAKRVRSAVLVLGMCGVAAYGATVVYGY